MASLLPVPVLGPEGPPMKKQRTESDSGELAPIPVPSSGNSAAVMNSTDATGNNLMINNTNSGTQQVTLPLPQQQQQPQKNSSSSTPQPIQPPGNSVPNSSTLSQRQGSVASPQPPPSISTSGDPTPTMQCVSSTPTHNVASSAGLTQNASLSMTSFAGSMQHQPLQNHSLHPFGTSLSYNAMGGGGGGGVNIVGGGAPHHMVVNSGPRMAAMAHMQHEQQQHSMRAAVAHGMAGPLRVDMSSQSPHGMIVPTNQIPMGSGMGPHDVRMSPMMTHQTVGPPHGMRQMPIAGGHQYIHQHHPHQVAAGGHPGMHSVMGSPGAVMPQQPTMGPGGLQPPGMVNMIPSPGGTTGHMQSHPSHGHMRPNLMIHRANPRPSLPNPMVTGGNAQIIVPVSSNPNHTSSSPQPPSNPSVSLGGGNSPVISGITPTVSGVGGEIGGAGITNSTSMGGGGPSGVSGFTGNFQASSGGGKPQNPSGTTGTSDPEKRKQIQQQLVLLLHAHKCQRREQDMQVSGDYTPCSLPHCKTMKNVLNHMAICQAGRNCPYPHCASSRQIITHWKNCTRADCPVCLPLKHASMPRKPGGGGGGGGGGAGGGGGGGPIGQPRDGFPSNPNQVMMNPQQEVARQMVTQSHIGGGGGGIPDYPNIGNPQAPSKSTLTIPIPSISSIPTKLWHNDIQPDLRQHLVSKLVEAIYPVHDPVALQDKRVYSLIQYAMKVEMAMFDMASSRENYYKLLAQKIYNIRKELEDRKKIKKSSPQPGQMLLQGSQQAQPVHQAHQAQQPQQPYSGSSGYNVASTAFSSASSGAGNCSTVTTSSMVNSPLPPPSAEMNPGSVGLPAIPSPLSSMLDSKKDILSKLVSSPSSGYQSVSSASQNSDSLMQQGGIPSLSSFKIEPIDELITGPAGGLPSLPSITIEPKEEPMSTGSNSSNNVDANANTTPASANSPPLQPNLQPPPAQSSVPLSSEMNPGSCTMSTTVLDSKKEQHMSNPPSERNSDLLSQEGGVPSLSAPKSSPPAEEEKTKKICPVPSLRKVFTKEKLITELMPVYDMVWKQDPESFPFRQPVDPKVLGIPEYFDIVKTPMDLCTIRRKLEEGLYKTGWEFCNDVYLMLDNAWLFNRKTSKVYKFCTKLSEVFEANIDDPMHRLGYCCGHRYTYHPQVLYCYGKPLCTIPRDMPYFGYQNRYVYCTKCFSEIQGETVKVGDDPLTATIIPKPHFKEMKNNSIDREMMVECIHCKREMHTVCVLHMDTIWNKGFQCENCLKALNSTRKVNKFSAKRLPSTKLATFLEERVNNFIRSMGCTEAGDVTIRVVSSSDKILDTRTLMKERYMGEFPEQFPFRTKAMFVFEEIDGVDVCFFGMHVQEYGSDCLAPNTRRVYISYLDSVHFFRPRSLRTSVYHEILIGYLDFCKMNGFLTAHIWACPPSEGDDYIFHCHPDEQKIPKPKRLTDWYRMMLDRGKANNVIHEYRDIFKHCTDEGITSVTEIPYFEGDFWPNVVEETIKELDQEAKQREASEKDTDGRAPKKADKRNKGSKKTSTRSKSSKKGNTINAGDDLSTKVYQTMEKHKDVFFTVLLNSSSPISSPLPGTTDPDNLISCDVMDGRDAFLTMSRERHWEFSSLRRAKYSTMAMLFEIHTQGGDKFVYNCNNCRMAVETRYHCKECDDFDLCVICYKEITHPHPMEKMGLGLELVTQVQDPANRKDPKEQRKASIENCIRFLFHATQCHNVHCKQPSCIRMKRVLTHTRECRLMLSGNWNLCTICKHFVLLCISHAKTCNVDKCQVPVCARIKKNLRDQRNQRRVQATMFMQQRMAQMNSALNNSAGAAAHPQNPQTTDISSPAPPAANVSPGNNNCSSTSVNSPAKASPVAGHTSTSSSSNANPGSNKPYINVPSPVAGPLSVGKGGPRTPIAAVQQGKSSLVASTNSPTAMHRNPSPGITPPAGKQDTASGMMVEATPGLPQELTIERVGGPDMMVPAHPAINSMGHVYHNPHHMGSYQHNIMANRFHQAQQHQAMRRHQQQLHQAAMRRHQQQQQQYTAVMSRMNPAMATQQHPSELEIILTAPQQHPQYTQQPGAGGGYTMPAISGAAVDPHSHPQYSQQVTGYGIPQNAHQLGPPPQYPANRPAQTAGYPQMMGGRSGGMVGGNPGMQMMGGGGGNFYQQQF